jgi:hypothetical protein
MTWHAWRWDGACWKREPEADHETLSGCAQRLAKVEDRLGIPSRWTAMTKGGYPMWRPVGERRRSV